MTDYVAVLRHMADNIEKGLPARCGVQYRCIGKNWFDLIDDSLFLDKGAEYRIKPATVIINNREIAAPLTVAPKYASNYFFPSLDTPSMCYTVGWHDSSYDRYRLEHGLCFDTREAAVAFTKAVLGIE